MALICAEYSSLFVFILSEMKIWHMNFMLCIYTPEEKYSFSYTSSIQVCIQKSWVLSTWSCNAKSCIKHHYINYLNPLVTSIIHLSHAVWWSKHRMSTTASGKTWPLLWKFQSVGVFCRSHWSFHSGTRGRSITNRENYFHSTWYTTLPRMQ
jgi:hypothetical protein